MHFTKMAGLYPETATHQAGVFKLSHFYLGWKKIDRRKVRQGHDYCHLKVDDKSNLFQLQEPLMWEISAELQETGYRSNPSEEILFRRIHLGPTCQVSAGFL